MLARIQRNPRNRKTGMNSVEISIISIISGPQELKELKPVLFQLFQSWNPNIRGWTSIISITLNNWWPQQLKSTSWLSIISTLFVYRKKTGPQVYPEGASLSLSLSLSLFLIYIYIYIFIYLFIYIFIYIYIFIFIYIYIYIYYLFILFYLFVYLMQGCQTPALPPPPTHGILPTAPPPPPLCVGWGLWWYSSPCIPTPPWALWFRFVVVGGSAPRLAEAWLA